MFERFTDRARKVMALANQEAQRFNHEYIGTEHILLGLVQEGSGVGANVLKNLGVDLAKVRRAVEKQVTPGQEMPAMGKLPQTPRAKKVIELAIIEAREMDHNYIGTEHLTLGLLGEEDGVAATVMRDLGLDRQQIRDEIHKLLGTGMDVEDEGATASAPHDAEREAQRLTDLMCSADANEYVKRLLAELSHLATKRLTDVYLTLAGRIRVEYRIAKNLTEVDPPADRLAPAIAAMLKHTACMDPRRCDIPQEGAIKSATDDGPTLRVTAVPIDRGEFIISHVEK